MVAAWCWRPQARRSTMSSSPIGSSSSMSSWKHENKNGTSPILAPARLASRRDSRRPCPVDRAAGQSSAFSRLLQGRHRGIELAEAGLVVLLLVICDGGIVVGLGAVLLGTGRRLHPGGLDHLQLMRTGRRGGGCGV